MGEQTGQSKARQAGRGGEGDTGRDANQTRLDIMGYIVPGSQSKY